MSVCDQRERGGGGGGMMLTTAPVSTRKLGTGGILVSDVK